MHSSTSYIAGATNRFSTCADVCKNTVAYGSGTQILLWDSDENSRGVSETLPGHQGPVTCVKFVDQEAFISSDDAGEVRVWKRNGSQWSSTGKKAHEKSISALCVYKEIVATGSSDSSVKIWRLVSEGITETQKIPMKGRYLLSIAMSTLPNSDSTILVFAGTDGQIRVCTRSDGQFVVSVVLSGHEDWIRSLVFNAPSPSEPTLVLASGSQDNTIRLWNIEPYVKPAPSASTNGVNGTGADELLDAFEESLGDLGGESEEGGRQISLKRHFLTVKAQQYSITFDALLIGHEAGVTSLSWRPAPPSSQGPSTPTLLSTSVDSSVILWSPSTVISSASADGSTDLWINRQRFGDVGGQRLGGFVGGLWSADGSEAMAWGWSGGWRRWRCINVESDIWEETGAITGHKGPVKGLAWAPGGEYLISVGLDQTTRIHGPVRGAWHELSRPQVHGYDVLGVECLSPTKFVSISDEKVVRAFEAPKTFVQSLRNMGVADFGEEEEMLSASASVPPLGLSNKAMDDGQQPAVDQTRPPFEGELAAMTLWPEIEKIFGHGYESISLAASNNRKLIATACKATSPEHAVVHVYDTLTWRPHGKPLSGHSLTVTRIAFSPDDRLILTVSRDRTWRLFEPESDGPGFRPMAADKSHARIIWDAAWAREGDVFATASRDKTVRTWARKDSESTWSTVQTIKASEAATAVDFVSPPDSDRRYLAVGLETGDISIYSNDKKSVEWTLQLDLPQAHVGHVTRVSWRPKHVGPIELACSSEDGIVKVIAIHT